MTDLVMMGLGPYRFGIATAAYQSLERRTDWRWPAQERIGRAPARQFVGPGEDKITLPGVIYPHYAGGLGQVDAMRATAGRGEPLFLVDGRGRVHGRWVILSLTETHGRTLGDGTPLRIDFTVELGFYGEDAP